MKRSVSLLFPKQKRPEVRSLSSAFFIESARLYRGDALSFYEDWPSPACIIADGPYGLGKYPGEPKSPDRLAEWYAPHVAAWSKKAAPHTTLWFWNSEIGWAKSHSVLELHGWQYEETVVWNKGIGHIAGNCNSKTIRGVPVVTEVAVRYTRRVELESHGEKLPIKDWLRREWMRSGLPMNQANEACGVANAATRKYLTKCHLWYFPPSDAVLGMSEWCRKYGCKSLIPYFSIDRLTPPTREAWDALRSKWTHTHGQTNVWNEPAVHGAERVKVLGSGALHANQKPLKLMEQQIASCTDKGDIVWEPFGGLCSASIAATRLERLAYAAEINEDYYLAASKRLSNADLNARLRRNLA